MTIQWIWSERIDLQTDLIQYYRAFTDDAISGAGNRYPSQGASVGFSELYRLPNFRREIEVNSRRGSLFRADCERYSKVRTMIIERIGRLKALARPVHCKFDDRYWARLTRLEEGFSSRDFPYQSRGLDSFQTTLERQKSLWKSPNLSKSFMRVWFGQLGMERSSQFRVIQCYFRKLFDLFPHDINHIEANKLMRHFRLIGINWLLESANWEAGRI
jgi:hypothetical protein